VYLVVTNLIGLLALRADLGRWEHVLVVFGYTYDCAIVYFISYRNSIPVADATGFIEVSSHII
jgi:hypothetical protein